ncbi:MAG: hypothetical protein QNJ97_28490 [Myxococcota bacterium]|nr:hypothetical protein [Myxococcota bacterium]
MLRYFAFLVMATTLFGQPLAGQSTNPRSADYLFAATTNDTRALWLNPAGLAVVPEASVFGEFVLHHQPDSNLRVGQVSLGFNAQGLSFGYQRDRLTIGTSNHTYRLGLARSLRTWAIGVAFSYYNAGPDDRGIDLGLRYRLLPPVQIGLVLRNIGEPVVRSDTLPLTGVASIGFAALPGVLTLAAELIAQDRVSATGLDMGYRLGARLSPGLRVPAAALIAMNMDSDLKVYQLQVGISIGERRQGIVVGGLVPDGPSTYLEALSVTGLARNSLLAQRR